MTSQPATPDAAPGFHLLEPIRSDRVNTRNIYVLVPRMRADVPVGGVKMLYRHVDVLNKHGFAASIVLTPGERRYQWCNNATPIRYPTEPFLTCSDILVVPEVFGPNVAKLGRGVKKVVYNQSAYLTFLGYPFGGQLDSSPYREPEVIATIVCSENSRMYLEYAFPGITLLRIRHSIDFDIFAYSAAKSRQLCFMPRKSVADLLQVINILAARNVLRGYDVVPIHRLPAEQDVARIMRDSLIFLSGSSFEGFGLPPAEAMACGCVVIGYHGGGGREYFDPRFSYAIEAGDILGFAAAVERAIREYEVRPQSLIAKGRSAAEYIRGNYSSELEERDIVNTWQAIFAGLP
jgi:glycosyltransferase involved in cell wall biosynthesis